MKKSLVATILILSGIEAMAHPGHEVMDSHLLHYLLTPDHALIAVILVIATVAILTRKRVATVLRRDK